MRSRAWVAFLAAALTGAIAQAGGTVIRGTVVTEKTAATIEVRAWALGEPVVADPACADAPLAPVAATPGAPFALEVADATLPLRVEVAAAGHVGATFDVVLPEQTTLPALWLP